jgi:diguanylate cyclase (GGDEF)-like protein
VTGAWTREQIVSRLTEAIASATTLGRGCSLLMLDVDHFKSINDAFGHLVGDQALAEIARRIQKLVRQEDSLCRFGGDEFVLVLPDTPLLGAAELAERLLVAVGGSPILDGRTIRVSLSIGASHFPDDGDNPKAIIERADTRAYVAKRMGRARVVVTDSDQPSDLHFEVARLLERDEAVSRISEFLAPAVDTSPDADRLMLIEGAAGAGRSALLQATGQRAQQAGWRVVKVACSHRLKRLTYAALAHALLDPRRAVPTDRKLTSRDVHRDIRQALATSLALDPQQPLLVAVDDHEHLDSSSRRFLLARLKAQPNLRLALVVGTDSSINVDRPHLKVAALPLTEAGVQIWLRLSLRAELEPAVLKWIMRLTHGFPKRVEWVLRRWVSEGILTRDGGAWTVVGDVAKSAAPALLAIQPQLTFAEPPTGTGKLVGRERECAEIITALSEQRLITLVGTGGAGKTRLAGAIAQQIAPAAWVALAPIPSGDHVLRTLASALGIKVVKVELLESRLLQALASARLVLVLDNCEHVVVEVARIAANVLARCPGIRIVATSREPLKIAEEIVWPVPPLAVPTLTLHDARTGANALLDYSAVEFFLARVKLVQPGFQLTPLNAGAIVRIVRRLDGHPLALELAAARARFLTVEEIAARLGEALNWPAANRLADPRQQTLKALVDWSYRLLPPEEQWLFRQLAIFVNGWTIEHAEAVVMPLPGTLEVEHLTQLVDKSMVVVESTDGKSRFRMLEAIRQFVYDELTQHAEWNALARRHAEHWANWAERAEPFLSGPDQSMWLTPIEAEIDNILAAMNWAQRNQPSLALRIARALWRFWDLRGRLSEGLEALQRSLRAMSAATAIVELHLRIDGYAHAAFMARNLEEYKLANELAQEGLALIEQVGATGELELAKTAKARAIAQFVRGACALEFNQPAVGQALLEQALVQFEASDMYGFAGTTWIFKGFEAEQRNDLAAARIAMERGLIAVRRGGEPRRIAHGLVRLGFIAIAEGAIERARDLFEETLQLARVTGDHAYLVNATFLLGRVALFMDQYPSAHTFLTDPLVTSERASTAEKGWALAERGKLALAENQVVQCRELAEATVAAGRSARLDELLAMGEWLQASAALENGQLAKARIHLVAADDGFQRSRKEGLCLVVETAARLAHAEGDGGLACRLMGGREALRARCNVLDHYPFMVRQRAAFLQHLRTEVEADSFRREFATGHAADEAELRRLLG